MIFQHEAAHEYQPATQVTSQFRYRQASGHVSGPGFFLIQLPAKPGTQMNNGVNLRQPPEQQFRRLIQVSSQGLHQIALSPQGIDFFAQDGKLFRPAHQGQHRVLVCRQSGAQVSANKTRGSADQNRHHKLLTIE